MDAILENEDPRFTDNFGAIQSIVTSSAQNDSGLFETNLRDERYLPFEGAGVISEWRIELPGDFRAFDYEPDVVLHLRYTARDGGAPGEAKSGDRVARSRKCVRSDRRRRGSRPRFQPAVRIPVRMASVPESIRRGARGVQQPPGCLGPGTIPIPISWQDDSDLEDRIVRESPA